MREIRPSGSEGGARFKPLSPPLSRIMRTTLLLVLNLVLCGIGPGLLGAEALNSTTPPAKADLAIVGAGISGLAAALDPDGRARPSRSSTCGPCSAAMR